MLKKILLIGTPLVVFIILGFGVWWLFDTDRLEYVANPKSQSETLVACSTKMVDTYNSAVATEIRDGASEPFIDTEAMGSLAKQIRSTDSYESDATCQTLLFWIAFYDNDYKNAVSAHTAIKDLHDKGVFADSNITSTAPLYSYEKYLYSLSGAEAEGGN